MRNLKNKLWYLLIVMIIFVSPVILTACKKNNPPPAEEPKTEYTVKFYNAKNQLIKTITVYQGEDAVEPTEDEKYMPGYIFSDWDIDFTNVQTDLNVYGIYANDNITDTDGDGLTDFMEIEFLNLDYLSTDSDGDSVLDCDEDFDNDGLKNLEEIRDHYTKPHIADTDGDGVNDGDEVVNGTDPCDEFSY